MTLLVMKRAHKFRLGPILTIGTMKAIVIKAIMEIGEETDPREIEKHQCASVIEVKVLGR